MDLAASIWGKSVGVGVGISWVDDVCRHIACRRCEGVLGEPARSLIDAASMPSAPLFKRVLAASATYSEIPDTACNPTYACFLSYQSATMGGGGAAGQRRVGNKSEVGVAGLYKLVRDAGLLSSVVDMKRVLSIFCACTATTPRLVARAWKESSAVVAAAAATAGQPSGLGIGSSGEAGPQRPLRGMRWEQFSAALVWLAAFGTLRTSHGRLSNRVEHLVKHLVPRAVSVCSSRGPDDGLIDVLLSPTCMSALVTASEQLHMIYDRITLVDGGPLSVHQFLEFTRAWSVFPNMLSSHQVMQVFAQAALVPIGGGRRAPTAAGGLQFPEFVEAIGRLALHVGGLPQETMDEHSPADKILHLLTTALGLNLDGESGSIGVAMEATLESVYHDTHSTAGGMVLPGELGAEQDQRRSRDGDDAANRLVREKLREMHDTLRAVSVSVDVLSRPRSDRPISEVQARRESEKWHGLQSRNAAAAAAAAAAMRQRSAQPPAAASAGGSSDATTTAAARRTGSTHGRPRSTFAGPARGAAPVDWGARGQGKGRVMVPGSGKLAPHSHSFVDARPRTANHVAASSASAGGAAAAAQGTSLDSHGPTHYGREVVGGGGAVARRAGALAARQQARMLVAGHDPLCLIFEVLYAPNCPYLEVRTTRGVIATTWLLGLQRLP
jgi:hypothetical protein